MADDTLRDISYVIIIVLTSHHAQIILVCLPFVLTHVSPCSCSVDIIYLQL